MTLRAITCEDVLHAIFFQLSPMLQPTHEVVGPEQKALKRTLFACATVNQTMSEYALRALWRALDGVAPILMILRMYTDAGVTVSHRTPCGY